MVCGLRAALSISLIHVIQDNFNPMSKFSDKRFEEQELFYIFVLSALNIIRKFVFIINEAYVKK